MTKQIISIIVLSLFLLSCNSAKKSTDNKEKKEQVLSKVSNFTIITIEGLDSFKNNPTMTLDFNKNTIFGHTSCNAYGGNIISQDNKINFERLMATKKYCQDLAKLENTFMGNLSKVRSYTLEENKILLYGKANTLLIVGEKIIE